MGGETPQIDIFFSRIRAHDLLNWDDKVVRRKDVGIRPTPSGDAVNFSLVVQCPPGFQVRVYSYPFRNIPPIACDGKYIRGIKDRRPDISRPNLHQSLSDISSTVSAVRAALGSIRLPGFPKNPHFDVRHGLGYCVQSSCHRAVFVIRIRYLISVHIIEYLCGSIFSGIGGFPFHMPCNSCSRLPLWPMEVERKHFGKGRQKSCS